MVGSNDARSVSVFVIALQRSVIIGYNYYKVIPYFIRNTYLAGIDVENSNKVAARQLMSIFTVYV